MKNRFLIICTVLFLSSCLAYGQEQASVTKDFSENKQGCIQHPWQGKKVGYIGDSITDPNCYGDNIKKYWDFLNHTERHFTRHRNGWGSLLLFTALVEGSGMMYPVRRKS